MPIDGWQWHPPVFTIVEFLLPHGCCDKTFRGTNKTIRIDIKVYIKKKVEFPLHRRAKELSVCDIKPHAASTLHDLGRKMSLWQFCFN